CASVAPAYTARRASPASLRRTIGTTSSSLSRNAFDERPELVAGASPAPRQSPNMSEGALARSLVDHGITARPHALYSSQPTRFRRRKGGRMAATVKTLLEHHGELYWGARTATPGYQYGISLDVVPQGVEAQVVYVLSDLDENDAELVDPEVRLSCYSVADLERNGIVPSDLMDEDESEDGPDARSAEDGAGVPVIGWYCVERSFFDRDRADELA